MRTPRTAASLVLVLAAVLAGCGAKTTVQGGNDTFSATTLTVYSNLPLLGSDAAAMQSVVNGEALALYDAGGRVRFRSGRATAELHVSLDSLNDADPKVGGWTDQATAASAKIAAQDLSAAAYIGDFDSGATAYSLPLTNQNDVLQLSPGSPYLGFTAPGPGVAAGQPHFFYPFHGQQHTFARRYPLTRPEKEHAPADHERDHNRHDNQKDAAAEIAAWPEEKD